MARPLTRGLCTVVLAASGAVAMLVGAAPAAAATNVAGVVDSGNTPLNVRVKAGTASSVVGSLPNGSRVTLVCQDKGLEVITGRVRTTNMWNKLTNGRFIADAYVRRTVAVNPCSVPTPAQPPQAKPSVATGWVTPVPGKPGQRFRPASNPTHDGVDTMEPRNTPILAASAGKVITVVCNTSGPSCDVDGSPSIRGCGWYVEIQHADQVITRYCHMVKKPAVIEGQQVKAGQVIGYVGTSGNSSGTHLHYEVHVGPGWATRDNAVDPIAFMARMNAPLGG